MTKQEINQQLKEILENNEDLFSTKNQAEQLHTSYSELRAASEKEQLQEFINSGGDELEFKYEADEEDLAYHDIHTTYEQRLQKQIEDKENAATNKLEEKKAVIEGLKAITETDKKSLRQAYDKAKALQERWDASGVNNSEELQELESQYKYNLELFYHNANITRQFINLDFEKNLTAKKEVLKKIESLLEEPDGRVVEHKLNAYKKEWFRVGPVLKELRDEAKQELDEVSKKVEAKLDEFYENQKELLTENLKKKITLCEAVNEIREKTPTSPKEFQKAANKVLDIQKQWKAVGRSEENDRIWEVFQHACDAFFDSKRTFFASLSAARKENKKKKLKLVEQVDALKDSEDWKITADQIIAIQKEWKQVGPAQPSDDQKLWKRFRAACDHFFNKKSEHYKGLGDVHEENLTKKLELLKNLEALEVDGNTQESINKLREIEKEWQSIGHVPFKKKDKLYKTYFEALNGKYDALKMDKDAKAAERFRNKVSALSSGNSNNKQLKQEKFKIRQQIERLEKKIAQYQNNINFFSGQEDNPLLKDINKNIKNSENQLEDLRNKLDLIYDMEDEAKDTSS